MATATKYTILAALIASALISSSDARRLGGGPTERIMNFDEEQLVTTGGVTKDRFDVNVKHSFDKHDGRDFDAELKKAFDLLKQAKANNLLEEDEEQLVTTGGVSKDRFNIDMKHSFDKKDGHNWDEEVKKALELLKQAKDYKLLEEAEDDVHSSPRASNSKVQARTAAALAKIAAVDWRTEVIKVKDVVEQMKQFKLPAVDLRLHDEDEEQLITTGAVHPKDFKIDMAHTFGKNDGTNTWNEVLKALELLKQAKENKLLEEDEEQLITTGGVTKDRFDVNVKHSFDKPDGHNWDEEIKKALELLKQAKENRLLDEDEEQLITTGAVNTKDFKIDMKHTFGKNDGTNNWDEIIKALDLLKEAKEKKLLEEEQEDQAQGGFLATIGAAFKPIKNLFTKVSDKVTTSKPITRLHKVSDEEADQEEQEQIVNKSPYGFAVGQRFLEEDEELFEQDFLGTSKKNHTVVVKPQQYSKLIREALNKNVSTVKLAKASKGNQLNHLRHIIKKTKKEELVKKHEKKPETEQKA